jgi:glucose-6-phosphate dehydrogenase assembly protein OpcA
MRAHVKARVAAARSIESRLREERRAEQAATRARREEKQRRRKANELKSSTFQAIDAQRLKKMNKKQLRRIKRTRMGDDGNVELAPAYS